MSAGLTRGRTALLVALYVYRRVQVCNSLTVTLPLGELSELSITLRSKQKALLHLEQAELIALKTATGRSARVTLKWRQND